MRVRTHARNLAGDGRVHQLIRAPGRAWCNRKRAVPAYLPGGGTSSSSTSGRFHGLQGALRRAHCFEEVVSHDLR